MTTTNQKSFLTAALTLLGLLFAGSPPHATAQAGSCPNAELRTGPSAYLPDCRAYEQVSPVDKNQSDVRPLNQAVAVFGEAITYPSLAAFDGSPSAAIVSQYLSTRGPSGWSTQGVTPTFENPGGLASPQYTGFSADLSRMVVDAQAIGTPNDLFRRNADGSLDLITPGMPPATSFGPPQLFRGASADYSHILFMTNHNLTSDADGLPDGATSRKLYESANGELRLASVLPDGTPSLGHVAPRLNVISANGSRVFWTPGGAGVGPIYLNEDGPPASIEITAPQCTSNPDCPTGTGSGSFVTTASNGSVAFFTSDEELTDDANTGPSNQGSDLYRYDAGSGDLTDLTPDSADANGADVAGVIGASADGSSIYFVARGVLASGATAGQPNLYLRQGGSTTLIATLASSDSGSWSGSPWRRSTRAQVSADGSHLLFTSTVSLTGYDNAGHSEVYLYEAGSGELTCVSCNPSGEPATGDAVPAQSSTIAFGIFSLNTQDHSPVNNLSADGSRVFFESPEALVSRDTNDQLDVYMWEEGRVHLISGGRSGSPSFFEGAGRSGDDAFFLTRSQLVGQDTDDNVDVYDARVGGGLAVQHPAPTPPPCNGGGCKPPASPPPGDTGSGSSDVSGRGNLADNRFGFGRAKRDRKRGTARLTVRIPGPGEVELDRNRKVKPATKQVRSKGKVRLRVRPTGKAKRKLRRKLRRLRTADRANPKARIRVRARVTYTPDGGGPRTKTKRLRLVKR